MPQSITANQLKWGSDEIGSSPDHPRHPLDSTPKRYSWCYPDRNTKALDNSTVCWWKNLTVVSFCFHWKSNIEIIGKLIPIEKTFRNDQDQRLLWNNLVEACPNSCSKVPSLKRHRMLLIKLSSFRLHVCVSISATGLN